MTSEQALCWQTYAAVVQTMVALLSVVVVFLLSIFINRLTKTISELQYKRSIFDAWMSLDTFLLSKPELVVEYQDLVTLPDFDGPSPDKKRVLLIFMLLNPLYSTFEGHRRGFVESDTLERTKPILRKLLEHEDVFEITQKAAFGPGFDKFCMSVKEEPTGSRHAKS